MLNYESFSNGPRDVSGTDEQDVKSQLLVRTSETTDGDARWRTAVCGGTFGQELRAEVARETPGPNGTLLAVAPNTHVCLAKVVDSDQCRHPRAPSPSGCLVL